MRRSPTHSKILLALVLVAVENLCPLRNELESNVDLPLCVRIAIPILVCPAGVIGCGAGTWQDKQVRFKGRAYE